jgi:nitrate/nitrite transporter NarK
VNPEIVTCRGSYLVAVASVVVAGLSAGAGNVGGAAMGFLWTLVVCWLLPRSVERDGDLLRVRYLAPRRRTIPVAEVRGVTTEKGIWMTRLELASAYPVVFPGRIQRDLELLVT